MFYNGISKKIGVKFSSFLHYSKEKSFKTWKKGQFCIFFAVYVHKKLRFRARKLNNVLFSIKKRRCFSYENNYCMRCFMDLFLGWKFLLGF